MFDDIDEPLRFIQLFDVSHRIQNEIKLQAITTEKLVLIYFDMTTDGTVLLWQIWKEMCEINGSFPFVECFSKPNNEDIAALPTVYARHRRYPFWLSLHGNGIDCHRTWEALYLDIIPIVWNSSLKVLYDKLPVLIIEDHRALTEAFLRGKLQEITKRKIAASQSDATYQYEKLRNAYWRGLVLKKSRHKAINSSLARHSLCWRAAIKTITGS
ncbi:unnamed protein product [Rotaria magnacalcarata]|uniref:Uncharacterized protein n=1 Tax=Rotaria magnacalcarata TaxID=392030 RepID=A0A816X2M7_9BILA|nr:unnamed protein product [Rotaria magnacalcarata]